MEIISAREVVPRLESSSLLCTVLTLHVNTCARTFISGCFVAPFDLSFCLRVCNFLSRPPTRVFIINAITEKRFRDARSLSSDLKISGDYANYVEINETNSAVLCR